MPTEDQNVTASGAGEKDVVSGKEQQSFQVSEKEWKEFISNHVRDEIQKEIKFDKASLFTVFGIFASIVTFVSIEIQILRTVCDFWNVVGFSIISLGSLLTFILILDYIGRGWRNEFKLEVKQFPWILMIFIVLLFVVGFVSVSFSESEVACKDEAVFKKYESDFLDKQLELQKRYDDKIQNLEEEVDDNKRVIENLKNAQEPKR